MGITGCGCDDSSDVRSYKLSDLSYSVVSDKTYNLIEFINNHLFSDGATPEEQEQNQALIDNFEKYINKLKSDKGVEGVEVYFRKVVYNYLSVDQYNKPVTLSSMVWWLGYFDNGEWCDFSPENIDLVEHYTITFNGDAPSIGFPMEPFVLGNDLVIMPDYIGYGASVDMVHPYMNHDLNAINSIDALTSGYAIFESLTKRGMEDGWKLNVMGASQGAGNAMAVHKYMDTHKEFAEQWHFGYTSCCAGPFSPVVTMDEYYTSGKSLYPVVFPLTIKAMCDSYPEIMGRYSENDIFSERYLQYKEQIDEMIASKLYKTSQINEVFYNNIRVTVDERLADNEIYLCDILSPEMLDKESDVANALYRCLELNDLTQGWKPLHSVYLYYSAGDMVVPYQNSIELVNIFGIGLANLHPYSKELSHQEACAAWMVGLLIR